MKLLINPLDIKPTWDVVLRCESGAIGWELRAGKVDNGTVVGWVVGKGGKSGRKKLKKIFHFFLSRPIPKKVPRIL